ncbi:hypothetical protein LTR87_015072 [Friedmanniomyces endolithicus]|nr:hypothetical protein LTR87_015072 [Friedmanniomyces endolithicus]
MHLCLVCGAACAILLSSSAFAAPVAPCTHYITVDPTTIALAATSSPCTEWIALNSTKTASYNLTTAVSVDPVATTPCTEYIGLNATNTATSLPTAAAAATTPCTEYITLDSSTAAISLSALDTSAVASSAVTFVACPLRRRLLSTLQPPLLLHPLLSRPRLLSQREPSLPASSGALAVR